MNVNVKRFTHTYILCYLDGINVERYIFQFSSLNLIYQLGRLISAHSKHKKVTSVLKLKKKKDINKGRTL